jgi:methionine-rich copper-binding protein CopC
MAALAATVGALALAVATAAPASGHTSLVRTVPEDGAVVRTAPTRVQLEFDEPVSSPATVVVTGPSGRVDHRRAVVSGHTVTAEVDVTKRSVDVGRYTVAFRVVSTDGHPVAGESTFEYLPPGIDPVSTRTASDEAPDTTNRSAALLAGLVVAAMLAAFLLLLPRRRG